MCFWAFGHLYIYYVPFYAVTSYCEYLIGSQVDYLLLIIIDYYLVECVFSSNHYI
jgi:hypothetical protein